MNFQPVSQETFRRIVQQGSYYFPAHRHYLRNTTVTCDRCQSNQIPACIGWQQYDLCLGCAQAIARLLSFSRYDSGSDDDDYATLMMTSSAYPDRRQNPFPGSRVPPPPSQDPKTVTCMQVSSAMPTTNMEVSSAFPPIRTRMQLSSAYPGR